MTPRRSLVTLAALVLLGGWFGAEARAEGAPEPAEPAQSAAPAAPAPPTTATCVLRGRTAPPTDLFVHGSATEAAPVARFTGGQTPITVFDIPTDGKGKRARVQTSDGSGKGGFRIEGYIELGRLPLYPINNLTVFPGHVWLAAQREVSLVGGAGERLRVEKKLVVPFRGTFSAWAGCGELTFTQGTPAGWEVPGDARGYLLKEDEVDLLDDATRDAGVVTTFYRTDPDIDVLFWSEERRGAFVHVLYRGDIVIDGWVKASAVKALPRGETMDQLAPSTTQRNAPRLALATQPRELRAPRELPIRAAAGDKSAVIGVVEPETELYVLDVVAGWAAVLPKALNVAPVGEGQFWVPAAALGIGKP